MQHLPESKKVLHPTQIETGHELAQRAAEQGVRLCFGSSESEPEILVTTAKALARVLGGIPLYSPPGSLDIIIFDESHHVV